MFPGKLLSIVRTSKSPVDPSPIYNGIGISVKQNEAQDLKAILLRLIIII
jgi:hypothetical protein